MPGSALPTSPAGSNFIPRREFVQIPSVPSSFSLLAFSSANWIRLSNFPQSVIAEVRAVLDTRQLVRQFKEDNEARLCKFILAGKPWANPKSVETETIIVEVFTAILLHGYHFLSLIDYGKEAGDHLSLVFGRPLAAASIPGTPTVRQPDAHVPFAISFPSSNIVRVVSPPLNSTPAILATVRAAWPRGIVAERKIGHSCFEFKLKGYSWLEEDNFYEDSLKHILHLLGTFSNYGFHLLTSLSFNPGKSRVKDFWIFIGSDMQSEFPKNDSVVAFSPAPQGHGRNVSLDGRPRELTPDFLPGHMRNATAPGAMQNPLRNSWVETGDGPQHSMTDPLPRSGTPNSRTGRSIPSPPPVKPSSPLHVNKSGSEGTSSPGSRQDSSPIAETPDDILIAQPHVIYATPPPSSFSVPTSAISELPNPFASAAFEPGPIFRTPEIEPPAIVDQPSELKVETVPSPGPLRDTTADSVPESAAQTPGVLPPGAYPDTPSVEHATSPPVPAAA